MDILDAYVLSEPSDQNVLDIFQGEWSSRLPDETGLVTKPGAAALFEDARVIWVEQVFGSVAGWDVLELGPLEGGHSFMFQKRNVNKLVAIEANTRAFLKCLCIKEILKLDRVEYKLGDLMSFLARCDARFQLVFASGVLYHMVEPVELIKFMSKVSDRVFIWTHYYDQNIVRSRKELAHKFNDPMTIEYDGESYECATQSYKDALNWKGFCGGPKSVSKWLTKDSIIRALSHYGLSEIEINFDATDHPNGPAFAICAQRPGA